MRKLQIGVIGNFSGIDGPRAARFVEIDRDSFDARMASLQVRIAAGPGAIPELRASSLDDLHPDALVTRVPALRLLLEARENVLDVAMIQKLLAGGVDPSVASAFEAKAAPPPAASARPSSADLAAAAAGDDLLSGVLSQTGVSKFGAKPEESEFTRMLRAVVEPYVDRTDYAEVNRRRALLDAAMSAQLRDVMHRPAFRGIEAAWRALSMICNEADSTESLKIWMYDADAAALSSGVEARAKQFHAGAAQAITDAARKAQSAPFDLILLLGETGAAGLEQLLVLSTLVRAAGARLLACADRPVWSGVLNGDDERWRRIWEIVRGHDGAATLVLCAPRVLVRAPYGARAARTEKFAFEEVDEKSPKASLLWGSSAPAVVAYVARTLGSGGVEPLGPLPLFTTQIDGEWEQIGPVEEPLTESQVERASEAGLCWVWGSHRSDAVVFPSVQSITRKSLLAIE